MASRKSDNKKPTSEREHETKRRPCLMCGQRFESGHFGERICKNCKSTAAWREGGEAA